MNKGVKGKKTRSPNFPFYTLEKGLSLAEILLEKYARYPVPFEVAIKAAGYSAKSSAGLQAIAALSAYGLIEVEGSKTEKKIAVSDLAFKILADKRPISPERDAAIKEAALKPIMFHKIFERYPDSPPADDALEYELVFTYKFNKGSVHDFITVFSKTMDYAKIYESGIIGDEYRVPETAIQEQKGDKPMIPGKSERTLPMGAELVYGPFPPVAGGEYEIAKFFLGGDISVRLVASAPITKFTQKTIDKLIKHLELDKEELPIDDLKTDNE
jgi:hypothetical protein